MDSRSQVYGRDRLHDMVRDTRRRLMDAAARLTGAPAGTCAWEGVELPGGGEGAAEAGAGAGAGAGPDGGDVVMAGADGELGWETAKTRATRCLQLLEKLASKVRGGAGAGAGAALGCGTGAALGRARL